MSKRILSITLAAVALAAVSLVFPGGRGPVPASVSRQVTATEYTAYTIWAHGDALGCLTPKPRLKISIIGDSISYGWGTPAMADGNPEGLRPQVARRLDAACQPYDLRIDAAPGSSSDFWLSRVDAINASFLPDVSIIALGTNSNCVPDSGAQLQQQMTTLYNSALHSRLWQVKIAPVFISYSRSGDAAAWVINSEPVCNDAIYRAQAQFPPENKMNAGYVAWDSIPTSLLVKDGLHYSRRAYEVAADLLYNGIAGTYGWSLVPNPCGLDGRRPGYGSTGTFEPCPNT